MSVQADLPKFPKAGLRGRRLLLATLAPHRWRVLGGMLGLVLSDACQLLIPLEVKRALDHLELADAAAQGRTAALTVLGLAAVTVLARYLWRYCFFSAARLCEVELRRRLLDHLLELPAGWYAQARAGEILALATNDIPAIRMALSMGLVAGFDASVFTVAALGAMLSLNTRLALWTFLPFPLLGVLLYGMLGVIHRRSEAVQEAFAALTEKARESVSGMRVLRTYVQEEGDVADFERYGQACLDQQLRFVAVDALFTPSILLLTGASSAILIALGGGDVLRGTMSLGSFTAFTSYLGLLSWPMVAAGWVFALVERGAVSMLRVHTLLDETAEADPPGAGFQAPSLASPEPGQASPKQAFDIKIEHLDFAYPGSSMGALRQLSLRIPAGGSLGIVGPVGSGKSTLVQLLLRLYDPPPTTVKIHGVDVLGWSRAALRASIAYVPQDAFMFSTTILENLRLGCPTASLEEIRACCQLAEVDSEILEFPKGYQTLLGERGVSLSGGQRQRVALARALLKQAPILLLDDTLSAVDAEAEHKILANLQARRPEAACTRQTTIVISHRISAVRDLDQILVLDEGRMIGEGTHETLMAVDGYYRQTASVQELEA